MGATLTFAAHCQRGHERIDFTDRDDFTAHMKGAHKATPGGWTSRAVKAAPWKAPKPAGNLAAVLASYTSHEPYVRGVSGHWVSDVSGVDGFVGDGVYRYDDDAATPPLEVLPANVRPILAGAAARGERWAVKVTGDQVAVSVGRTATEQASFVVVGGKVRPNLTQLTEGTRVPLPKLADVKRVFPAA